MPTSLPALAASLFVSLLAPLTAQTVYPVKIGGGPVPVGDAFSPKITSDGTRVVFLADTLGESGTQLFSVPIDGGTPVTLSAPGVFVSSFEVSNDGSTAVYRANDDQNRRQLYAVPVTGGAVTQLSQNTPSFAFVRSFAISPDNFRVVYLADGENEDVEELFSVPLAGGTVTKLIAGFPTNADVERFLISEIHNRVIYLADQDSDQVSELYSVPIAGGASVKLNGTLDPGGEVRSFKLNSNGFNAVYLADEDVVGVIELFTVPAQGGFGASRRNGNLTSGGNVLDFEISPSGGAIAYRADQESDEVVELYVNSFSGLGSAVKVNGPLVAGGDVSSQYTFSLDSLRVIYRADQEVDQRAELYSVTTGATGLVKLNPPSTQNSNGLYTVAPDGIHVVFQASEVGEFVQSLYSVPVSGGAATNLSGSLVAGGSVSRQLVSPDASRVLFVADKLVDNVLELFSVPIDGSAASVRLNSDLVAGGGVRTAFGSPQFSPDSSRVVYIADQEFDGAEELFSVPTLGGAVATLSPPPASGGDIGSFAISPDGTRVVYISEEEIPGTDEVFSVSSRGGTPVKLSGSVNPGSIFRILIDPGGSQVYFIAAGDTPATSELYRTPIDGGPRTKVNAPLVALGDVLGFAISPDGTQLAYVASQDTPGVFELYVVPTDLSAAPVKVSGTLVPGGDVSGARLQFNPDGSRVLFLADKETNNLLELFSAPSDGSAPPVKLNGPAIPEADRIPPIDFRITPDGSRVVYRWDQETDEQFELYSVPVAGGTVVKLHSPLPDANGDVRSFQISADGNRVLFNAELETAGLTELYSVPADGSSAPLKLNGVVTPGSGEVFTYAVTPDGTSVLYEAGQLDGTGLFQVPVNGSSAPQLLGPDGEDLNAPISVSPDGKQVVYWARSPENALFGISLQDGSRERLSAILPSTSRAIRDITIDSLSKRVIYRADPVIQSFFQIFSVPIGGGTPLQLSALSGPDRRIESGMQVAPGGSPVIYEADQRIDNVFELFAARGQAFWDSSAGNWEEAANWQGGVVPDETIEAVVAVDAVARVSSSGGATTVDSLQMGGSPGASVLEFLNGAGLTVCNGAALLPGAVIRGDGVLSLGQAALEIPAGAELRSATGEKLSLQSGAVSNAGRIEVIGSGLQQAEIELSGAATNEAGTGALVGRNALFRIPAGLTNEGSLSFSSGVNDVMGEVTNEPGGIIVVSGGALAIFNEDVTNNSVINVSASGGISSAAVFFGSFSGNGVGGAGAVFLEGDTRPGFSPGTMAFGGDVTYGPFAVVEMEIGGTQPGTEHDQISVSGHLALSGMLQVTLIDGFVPEVGMVFDLWDAGSVSGAFSSVSLPPLPAGLFWNTCSLNTTGELFVALVPESYAGFAAHYGLVTSPEGDEEGDKVSNLIEYLAGRNPLQVDVWPAVEARAGEISFVSAAPAAKDLLVELERSTTLQDTGPGGWEVIATRIGNGPWSGTVVVQMSPAGPGLERASVTHTVAGDVRRFYRLKVTPVP